MADHEPAQLLMDLAADNDTAHTSQKRTLDLSILETKERGRKRLAAVSTISPTPSKFLLDLQDEIERLLEKNANQEAELACQRAQLESQGRTLDTVRKILNQPTPITTT
jgi:hypothetical protein